MPRDTKNESPRFGIGEWYGYNICKVDGETRRALADHTLTPKSSRDDIPCPFRVLSNDPICTKEGGVCSLRLYSPLDAGIGMIEEGPQSILRATCPYRFQEDGEIFRWVSETVLGTSIYDLISEVGFLEGEATLDSEGGADVGRIDMVLVSRTPERTDWVALEIQAVYFSGSSMRSEFKAYSEDRTDELLFPVGRRRPDYRSSGPKRLMPQLQIKVPTLRRWGKKLAVVVDRAFFESLGEMDHVDDISNGDIAWFIVDFKESDEERAVLTRGEVRFTTLERSVEGLTGGKPVSLKTFEERILAKIV